MEIKDYLLRARKETNTSEHQISDIELLSYLNRRRNELANEIIRLVNEDFFYDNFVNSHKDEIAAKGAEFVFKPYLKTGFPMVKLRRLLSYSDEKNLDKRIYFEHKKLTCNKDLSSVTFKPHAPFGKTDYTTDPILSCEKVKE